MDSEIPVLRKNKNKIAASRTRTEVRKKQKMGDRVGGPSRVGGGGDLSGVSYHYTRMRRWIATLFLWKDSVIIFYISLNVYLLCSMRFRMASALRLAMYGKVNFFTFTRLILRNDSALLIGIDGCTSRKRLAKYYKSIRRGYELVKALKYPT